MKVVVLTPIKDSVAGPAHASTLDFAVEATRRGHDLVFKTSWLSSNLAKARCSLLRAALSESPDRILWLDDDIVFRVEDALALLALEHDLVSGCYKRRETNGETIGHPLEGGRQIGALLEMERIGLGFASMSLRCASTLFAAHGDGLFEFRFDGRRMLGEDEVLCDRWRAQGGAVWIHLGIELGHVGPTIFR